MARKSWDELSPGTRKRYLAKGRKLGLSESDVRQYHSSGRPMGEFRGHKPRPGVSERQWSKLLAQAKASELGQSQTPKMDPAIILESVISKGFTYEQIMDRLIQMRADRDEYRNFTGKKYKNTKYGRRSVYKGGPRKRYDGRVVHMDIEMYFYH